MVEEIRTLEKMFQVFQFSHVKKGGNLVAHRLAHVAKDYVSETVWMEDYPPYVQSVIDADMAYFTSS